MDKNYLLKRKKEVIDKISEKLREIDKLELEHREIINLLGLNKGNANNDK